MMDARAVLGRLGGQSAVRSYLRGVEPGSEFDQDAERAMLAAIERTRGAGVHDVMADVSPYLYAQACLILCEQYTDREPGSLSGTLLSYADIIPILRYDERNVPDNA